MFIASCTRTGSNTRRELLSMTFNAHLTLYDSFARSRFFVFTRMERKEILGISELMDCPVFRFLQWSPLSL